MMTFNLGSYMKDSYSYHILFQKKPNEDLSKCCESLFDILDSFADTKKNRANHAWPLQIMLLILSPVSIIDFYYIISPFRCL